MNSGYSDGSGGAAGAAHTLSPELQKERRIAHGPESPGGRPGDWSPDPIRTPKSASRGDRVSLERR